MDAWFDSSYLHCYFPNRLLVPFYQWIFSNNKMVEELLGLSLVDVGQSEVYQKFFCSHLLGTDSASLTWNIPSVSVEQKKIAQRLWVPYFLEQKGPYPNNNNLQKNFWYTPVLPSACYWPIITINYCAKGQELWSSPPPESGKQNPKNPRNPQNPRNSQNPTRYSGFLRYSGYFRFLRFSGQVFWVSLKSSQWGSGLGTPRSWTATVYNLGSCIS